MQPNLNYRKQVEIHAELFVKAQCCNKHRKPAMKFSLFYTYLLLPVIYHSKTHKTETKQKNRMVFHTRGGACFNFSDKSQIIRVFPCSMFNTHIVVLLCFLSFHIKTLNCYFSKILNGPGNGIIIQMWNLKSLYHIE